MVVGKVAGNGENLLGIGILWSHLVDAESFS